MGSSRLRALVAFSVLATIAVNASPDRASDAVGGDLIAGAPPLEEASAPAAPLDAPDWPTAIEVDRDGTVWLSMSTDTPDDGGVAYYTADLEFQGGWGIAGSPRAVTVGPSRDVYVDEREMAGEAMISRFTLAGLHTQSWVVGAEVADLDAAPNGDVIQLEGDGPANQRIVAFASTGKPLDDWEAPADSLSLATDRRGHVFVGQRAGGLGAIWHYSMSGTRLGKWSITNLPIGVDIGPDDRVYSAGTYGTGRGDVLIFERGGSFVSGIMVDAQPKDVAVGPDGSVYLIVWVPDEGRHEVRRYDAAGQLLISLEDIHPVQGFPRPPTATAGPPPTAPTPRWPSATPRPATATPGGTPSGTPSATPSGGTSTTPSATPSATDDPGTGTPGTAQPTSAATSTPTPTEGDLRTPTPVDDLRTPTPGDVAVFVPVAANQAGIR